MQGPPKLEARPWDTGWNCYDLEADPLKQSRLPLEQCDDLLKLAEKTYGRLPGKDVPKP